MSNDPQWHVNVEVTPANASAFRSNNRIAAQPPRAVWIRGVLSLRQPDRLHLLTGKGGKLGGVPLAATASATSSVFDGVAGGSTRWLYREVLLWRHGTMIRLLMSKPNARELFAAINYEE